MKDRYDFSKARPNPFAKKLDQAPPDDEPDDDDADGGLKEARAERSIPLSQARREILDN